MHIHYAVAFKTLPNFKACFLAKIFFRTNFKMKVKKSSKM